MIRNKALRLVLRNLLLVGTDVLLVGGGLSLNIAAGELYPDSWGYGGIIIFLLCVATLFILCAHIRGVLNRLLIRETWIPNAIYVIELFLFFYWYWINYAEQDGEILFILAVFTLLCGAISSGASLIIWAIQCKVQKKRAAKQAVLLEE